ncbi:MAG: glycosyl hydrolase [Flavobacteriales bacterium]|nr:glycosyl hydrolase [Flavobacteriales bacterium]
MRTKFVLIFLMVIQLSFQAQRHQKQITYSTAATQGNERLDGLRKRQLLKESSLTNHIPVRNIGPSVMGGRVTDIEVDPQDPTHFFVAFASGGLWVTYNNGTSFTPIFDHEMVMTIGDFDVDWQHDETIWIGTGEVNSSRSSYSGVGIFVGTKQKVSSNNAETWKWEHRGLADSHHIGRVIIDPRESNVLYVAVLGSLYSENPMKGVYKTTDAGKTWTNLKLGNSKVGVVDMVMNEQNPLELFAASWNRSRQAWKFSGNGDETAIWHSLDGGVTWKNISSTAMDGISGFNQTPEEMIGRIGLAFLQDKDGKHLYAMVDNQSNRADTAKKETKDVLVRRDFQNMSVADFAKIDTTQLSVFLRKNGFPQEYTVEHTIAEVNAGRIVPNDFYKYLSNANDDMFNTPIVGAEVYRYDFEHTGWKRTHEDYLDDVVFTYGYYFGLIRIDPSNHQRIYIAGVPLLCSNDGGAHWKGINPDNVHVDHHALWIDPNDSGHIINGSDGGVQISYDNGETFINCNSPIVSQFYAVQVDMATPYNVYGGMQDNGVWYGSSQSNNHVGWKITGHHEFSELIGGDGMQVMVDTRDNYTIYTGSQFGEYMRTSWDFKNNKSFDIHHEMGEEPLRWNWQTPILLSPHNQDIVYICSNKVHRSTDRGDHFQTISGDMTKSDHIEGNVPYATITCIDESVLQFGLLAIGTDDGNVMVSKDNGYSWENRTSGLPANLWVSRIIFSRFEKGRIYITLSGYRQDHFKPYVFVSEDFGLTWKNLGISLPSEPVNVIREDFYDRNILYIGTDHGVYYTLDRGANWKSLSNKIPEVAVHDLVIQSRENELVIGTHGRGIWIADIQSLRQLNDVKDSILAVMSIDAISYRSDWGNGWCKWIEPPVPHWNIPIYTKSAGKIRVDIFLEEFKLTTLNFESDSQSLNHFEWDLSISEEASKQLMEKLNAGKVEDEKIQIERATNGKYYLPPGIYNALVEVGGVSSTEKFEIQD